jgi:14-3-3 protein epsilon
MAKLAEQAERFEDMIEYMKRVSVMQTPLSVEERNLLSVAYKNAVGKGRTAWRAVVAQMTKDQEQYGQVPKCIHDYKNQIEVELKKMCEEILGLIKQNADGSILYDTNPEAIVFYIKMQGDYWRYISEFSTDDTRAYSAAEAYQSYYKALEKAKEGLSAIHPIRLGLALNFSVFYFEVYGKQQEACALAKEALDAAEAEGLRGGDAETLQDSGAIMALLRDNLHLWKSDMMQSQGEGRPPEQDGTVCEDF